MPLQIIVHTGIIWTLTTLSVKSQQKWHFAKSVNRQSTERIKATAPFERLTQDRLGFNAAALMLREGMFCQFQIYFSIIEDP